VQKGIEMNSYGCLLDPCWFGCSEMGVFLMDLQTFFLQFANFEHIFLLCIFVKVQQWVLYKTCTRV
jgi:hypothetical protein